MTLRPHQTAALADLYARMSMRMGEVVDIYLHPPPPSQDTYTWNYRRIEAESALGELWVLPCRAGKTRIALSALFHWDAWLEEWGVPPALRAIWARPHLVLAPSDLVRDGPFPSDWKAVRPPWSGVRLVPIPTLPADELWAQISGLLPGDIAVVTYDTLRHRANVLSSIEWQVILADEVHHLKNPTAVQTQAAYMLKSVARIGMSATPISNYVHDLREVLAWIQGWTVGNRRVSAIWPSSAVWKRDWCRYEFKASEKGGPARRIRAGAAHPEYLYHKLRAEVMISATRDEVSDAPDPVVLPTPIPLSDRQREVYEQLSAGMIRWLNEHDTVEAFDTGPGLAQMAYLFALCADARQLEISIAKKNGGIDNILQYTDIRPNLAHDWALADKNSKLKVLTWLLKDVATKGEQIVVLTGFAQLARMLEKDLLGMGYSAASITGAVTGVKRSEVVSRFQKGETQVVTCTRAAWEGISLRAPYAVLFGFVDWVPGMVEQALLRTWNMFDTEAVTVYDVYAPGTVEEWNRKRLADKDRYVGVLTDFEQRSLFQNIRDVRNALGGVK